MGGSAGHGISVHSIYCSGESINLIMTNVTKFSQATVFLQVNVNNYLKSTLLNIN